MAVFFFGRGRLLTVLTSFFLSSYDKIPYVDLDKPWWDASVNSALTLQGIQYAAVSALDMTVYDFVNVLLFNKQMILDNGMGDVYAIVQEGNWTMDTMQSMMTAVAADTNGDGVMDLSDQYGYVCTSKNILPSFWIASETLTITKDADDMPVTNTELERTGAILEALSSESYRTVIPAYYDKALKSRTSRDAESADMLDLIFNNRVIDMGDTAWVDLIRDKVLEKVVYNDDRNLSSKVASLEKSITTSVEKLAEAIANRG